MLTLPSPTIVIPTYWGRPTGDPPQPNDAIFDHPTPIDGPSTLSRLLDSLAWLQTETPLTILVLVAVVAPELSPRAESRVADILRPLAQRFRAGLAGRAAMALLWPLARTAGLDPAVITLRNYAGVRNLQLLIPLILGSKLIVALDDDELVAPDYLTTVRQTAQQPGFYGAAGFYEDANGSIFLPETPPTGNIFLDKAAIMNAATRRLLDAPGRWPETAVAFGGNMLFGRDMVIRVGFDPGITRGEDLDYVLNARLAGIPFWLDKKLRITHLPPHQFNASPYVRMAEDVRRFIYQRAKLRQAAAHPNLFHPIPDAIWQPYPGRFLQDDLPAQARTALETIVTPGDRRLWGDPATIVQEAQIRAAAQAPRYLTFAQRWPTLTNTLAGNDALRRSLTPLLFSPVSA